jgi:hypothetical protein
MTTITISELSPSYLTEMEANEITSVVGGLISDLPLFGTPNTTTGIVFTPVGGTQANVLSALNLAIGYGGLNGFVFEVIHGGSFGFLAYKPTFSSLANLPAG